MLEKRAGVVDPLKLRHQVIGNAPLIDLMGHLRQHQNRPRLGCQDKEAPRHMVVVEGPHAELVSGAEHRPSARVPNGKREITQEAVHACCAPGEVGLQDQPGVTDHVRPFGHPQRREQFLAVIEPHIGGDDAA